MTSFQIVSALLCSIGFVAASQFVGSLRERDPRSARKVQIVAATFLFVMTIGTGIGIMAA